MDIITEQEPSIAKEQYNFQLFPVDSSYKKWILKVVQKEDEERCSIPTVNEMFKTISNIFNKIDVAEDIQFSFDGNEQWFTRGMTELEFYKQFSEVRC